MIVRRRWITISTGGALLASGLFAVYRLSVRGNNSQQHYDRDEMELIISAPRASQVRFFHAAANIESASEVPAFRLGSIWVPPGSYFVRCDRDGHSDYYAAPAAGYGSGPEPGGALRITVRQHPSQLPPQPPAALTDFVFIPSGHFLLGDRLNPREQHYVFVTGFFMAPFETTNAQFRAFLDDPAGYAAASNWTEEGLRWRDSTLTHSSAKLAPADAEWRRFGQPDQPVTTVNWYEANAYCRWLNAKIGAGRWIYSLPTDAEWEKAARGPDNFDYGLGMNISDAETPLYNWKKNPDVPVTVVGWGETRSSYKPNRYGLYHGSGNVAEWTQSIFRPYGRQMRYEEDDRNHESTPGRRTVRGGSWYSATIAPLYLPYRDAFQPDHANNDLGFRVAARLP